MQVARAGGVFSLSDFRLIMCLIKAAGYPQIGLFSLSVDFAVQELHVPFDRDTNSSSCFAYVYSVTASLSFILLISPHDLLVNLTGFKKWLLLSSTHVAFNQ